MRRKPIFALTSHSNGTTARQVVEGPWLTSETKRFQAYFGIKEFARNVITVWAETLAGIYIPMYHLTPAFSYTFTRILLGALSNF